MNVNKPVIAEYNKLHYCAHSENTKPLDRGPVKITVYFLDDSLFGSYFARLGSTMFGGESKIEIMLITWLCRRKVLRVVKGGHHWCRFGV